MKCPRCTHQNPPGVKFCSECGQRMGTLCADCNAMNLTESKFCHQCGQFLLKTEHIPADLEHFLRDKAGGNPFYLEEIINSLVETKTLD